MGHPLFDPLFRRMGRPMRCPVEVKFRAIKRGTVYDTRKLIGWLQIAKQRNSCIANEKAFETKLHLKIGCFV